MNVEKEALQSEFKKWKIESVSKTILQDDILVKPETKDGRLEVSKKDQKSRFNQDSENKEHKYCESGSSLLSEEFDSNLHTPTRKSKKKRKNQEKFGDTTVMINIGNESYDGTSERSTQSPDKYLTESQQEKQAELE